MGSMPHSIPDFSDSVYALRNPESSGRDYAGPNRIYEDSRSYI